MYQMTPIQIQVLRILIPLIPLTHQIISIINEDDVQKTIKINAGVKQVSVTLSKHFESLHPSYLQPRTNQR